MATRDGYLVAGPEYGADLPARSSNILSNSLVLWAVRATSAQELLDAGPVSNSFPVSSHAVARNGYVTHTYFDDYYNRIHIVPGSFNVGDLLSTEVRTVVVWNAYFVFKTLDNAALGPQTGIELTLPVGVTVPYEIEPLRELSFTLQINLQGPPEIESYITITIEGEDYVVPIIGRRVLLFPFAPNWSSPFDETVTMRSWAIPSEDGGEQTGSESGEIARRTFEFNVNLKNANQSARLESLLFTWQARFFGVPNWAEETYLDSDVPSGSLVLPMDTYGLSFEPGAMVALYYDQDKNEIREIESVAPNAVTITTSTQYDWPQGARAYPCFVALLADDVSGTRETSTVSRVPVMFECEPSVTPGNTAYNPPPLTYRGEELYLGKINWKSGLPFSFASDRQKVDPGTGRFVAFSAAGFSRFSRRHNWTLYDREGVFDFRKFLGRRQGMARSVYMPSGNADFELTAPVLSTEQILVVKNTEYGALAGAHPARRDIVVQLNDGSYFCRRITSTNDFGSFTHLNIDVNFGEDVYPEDVFKISFLTLYRFQSGACTLRHLTTSKVTVDAMLVAKLTKD